MRRWWWRVGVGRWWWRLEGLGRRWWRVGGVRRWGWEAREVEVGLRSGHLGSSGMLIN